MGAIDALQPLFHASSAFAPGVDLRVLAQAKCQAVVPEIYPLEVH